MTAQRVFVLAFCMVFFTHCAYITSKRQVHSKNYALNVEEQATLYSPMIISEFTSYVTGRGGHELSEELESWRSFDYPVRGSVKEELIYNGRSDNIIHVSFKEYKDNLTRPSSSQTLTYDLGYSDIIEFRNYKIRILNATDEYIRFVVLAD